MSEKDKSKPAEILEKIISGKIHKIVAEVTLTGQPYVLDTNMSVADALKKEGADVLLPSPVWPSAKASRRWKKTSHAEVMKQAGLA